MVRKVVGKISREMNRDVEAHVNSNNKDNNITGRTRTVSAPRSQGLGRVYKDDDAL